VPCLCEFNPGICLTTEEKAWKNLSQGSRRVIVCILYINKTPTQLQCPHIHTPTLLQNPHIHTHPHIKKLYKAPHYKLKQTQYKIYPTVTYRESFRVQRGHGVGSFFRELFHFVKPLLYSGINVVGKEALKTGINYN